mgnify:CR=1 FL=1
MKIRNNIQALGFLFILVNSAAVGGIFDPDCTAGKAARSAAMKATVGVGGRCSPAEAATDTAPGLPAIDDKGPTEKQRKQDHKIKPGGGKLLGD